MLISHVFLTRFPPIWWHSYHDSNDRMIPPTYLEHMFLTSNRASTSTRSCITLTREVVRVQFDLKMHGSCGESFLEFCYVYIYILPSLKLIVRTWKSIFGRILSFWVWAYFQGRTFDPHLHRSASWLRNWIIVDISLPCCAHVHTPRSSFNTKIYFTSQGEKNINHDQPYIIMHQLQFLLGRLRFSVDFQP